MNKIVVWTQIVAIALAGCASGTKDITPLAVSPMQYSNYDCDQIAADQRRIYARVGEIGGRLDQAASNDNMIANVESRFWLRRLAHEFAISSWHPAFRFETRCTRESDLCTRIRQFITKPREVLRGFEHVSIPD